MGTPMSAVSLRQLIASVEETQRKLQRAEAQLVLLRDAVREARVRLTRAHQQPTENQATQHSVELRINTLQGVAEMFQKYSEV